MSTNDQRRRRLRVALPALGIALVTGSAIAVVAATRGGGDGAEQARERTEAARERANAALEKQTGQRTLPGEAGDLVWANMRFNDQRTAPAGDVPSAAPLAAFAAAKLLPQAPGAGWGQITNQPYQSDPVGFQDPVWGSSGGGAGLVSGLVEAIAIKGSEIFIGANEGGVWRSRDGGTSWTPVFDKQPSLSIGSLAVNPADGSLWAGTGTPDDYYGAGIYRSTDDGGSWSKVGGSELDNAVVGHLAFDGNGTVIAATNRGIWRHAAGTAAGGWQQSVISPTPTPAPYGMVFANDVEVRPGTGGKEMVASIAWRGGTTYDGFYSSLDGGKTFTLVANPGGAVNPKDVRRTTFAYAADGSKLYALVQSAVLYDTTHQNGNTTLNGIYVSPTGSAAGQWNKIADYRKLQQSGSALKVASKGYSPGVQAWYNQFLGVDPQDPNHVYVGLEEVFETRNAGSSWTTVGPYWNFTAPCAKVDPASCPSTTHPDQHAVAFANGRVYVGNDGGLYSRKIDGTGGWTNHNANLHTLLYYFAGSGRMGAADAVWGGLQDNGVSALFPGSAQMIEPQGGDGGDIIVDPTNANRVVAEYVGLEMTLTTNAGASDGVSAGWKEITPSCYAFDYTPSPCDPNAQFIAPFRADQLNTDHWVAGGQFVWDNQGKGWDTRCSAGACDWKPVWDTGAGHSITSLSDVGSTTYAGWCGPCNPSRADVTTGFASGIDTNAGGTWHRIAAPNLPNRWVAAVAADPADPQHVYAVYGGYSRKWIPSAGVGHVYESHDGGATWTDISGNLPDAPADDVLLANGKLVLATDVGVFSAPQGGGAATSWSRLGSNLPNAVVTDLSFSSDKSSIVAATYGRGLWRIPTP